MNLPGLIYCAVELLPLVSTHTCLQTVSFACLLFLSVSLYRSLMRSLISWSTCGGRPGREIKTRTRGQKRRQLWVLL